MMQSYFRWDKEVPCSDAVGVKLLNMDLIKKNKKLYKNEALFQVYLWCKMICKHCNEEFNQNSLEKKKIGGYINECPDCVEERGGDLSSPMYLGVTAGNGKMSDITILQFSSDKDRALYAKSWKNNSGFNKGKSCQLGNHLTSMSGMKFKIVAENRGNENHKGKV